MNYWLNWLAGAVLLACTLVYAYRGIALAEFDSLVLAALLCCAYYLNRVYMGLLQ